MSKARPLEDTALLELFKSLASEKRIELMFTVFGDKQEHTVGEVAERLQIANSTASAHLAILRRAGILLAEKRAREVYFRVNKDAVQSLVRHLEHWLTCC